MECRYIYYLSQTKYAMSHSCSRSVVVYSWLMSFITWQNWTHDSRMPSQCILNATLLTLSSSWFAMFVSTKLVVLYEYLMRPVFAYTVIENQTGTFLHCRPPYLIVEILGGTRYAVSVAWFILSWLRMPGFSLDRLKATCYPILGNLCVNQILVRQWGKLINYKARNFSR